MVPDEVDDTQIEGSKPAEADTLADNEVPNATNKEDGGQTWKPMDTKPVHKCSNRASSGSQDGPVCYGPSSLMVERTSIPRTISLFIVFRGQAEYFS